MRTLDREGDWIYVGGQFNRISGGVPIGAQITLGRAARVRVSDGRPDGTWKPNFDGVPMELDATAERVYFGGHFTTVNGNPARKVAVITTSAPPTQVAGLNDQNWLPSTTNVQTQYRQIIREFGDNVWIGGSEHDFQMYTKSGFNRVRGNIGVQGGDFQTAVELNGVVYGACHCDDFIHLDASTWPDPGTNWTEVNQISFIGAWDAETGDYLPNFNPSIDSRAGAGPWEMIKDDNGCLWFGGDMSRGGWTNGAYQWLGGFGRSAPPTRRPRPRRPGSPPRPRPAATSSPGAPRPTTPAPPLRGAARRPRHRHRRRDVLHRHLGLRHPPVLRAGDRHGGQPLGEHPGAPRREHDEPGGEQRHVALGVRRRGPGHGLAGSRLRRLVLADRRGQARLRRRRGHGHPCRYHAPSDDRLLQVHDRGRRPGELPGADHRPGP
ncbi:hypothetical protein ACFQX6_37850 [Streptosporangium lutulentum]